MANSHATFSFGNLIEDIFFLICQKLIPEDIDALSRVDRETCDRIMSEKANHVLWKPKYELHRDVPPSTLPIKNYRQRLVRSLTQRRYVGVVSTERLSKPQRIFSIAREGDIESVRLMLEHPVRQQVALLLLSWEKGDHIAPLQLARQHHQLAWLNFCYLNILKPQQGTVRGLSRLGMAVETLQPMSEIKELIKDNAALVATERFSNYVHDYGYEGYTSAHLAAACGHVEFIQYVYENHQALFQIRLQGGSYSKTVLDFAIRGGSSGDRGSAKALQLLLDWKEEATEIDDDSLLMRAARSKDMDAVKVVLAAKPALLTQLDSEGKSAVDHIATCWRFLDIVLYLLRAGCPYRRDIALNAAINQPTFVSELLKFDPTLLEERMANGNTLLHVYCIAYCTSPRWRDSHGKIFHDYEIILSTSWARSLIHTTNHDGMTPFQVAVSAGAPVPFLKAMIKMGADKDFNPVKAIKAGRSLNTEELENFFLLRVDESHNEIKDILWQLFLYTRDRCADSRKKQVPEILGCFCFWSLGGYTRTQKLAAVAALFDVLLDDAEVSLLTPHLEVLKEGKLGKIFNLPGLQFYLAKKTGLDSAAVEMQHHSPQMRLAG